MVENDIRHTLQTEASEPIADPALHTNDIDGLQKTCRLLVVAAAMTFAANARAEEPGNNDDAPKNGTLVIAGGGQSEEIDAAFVKLAGTKNIVLIPTASKVADEIPEQDLAYFWKPPAPVFFNVLHTRDRTKADEEGFSKVLKKANGVWMSGGAQGFLTDAFRGTLVDAELRALLNRGGVIGGTSAGASVMGKDMIRDQKKSEDGSVMPILDQGLGLYPDVLFEQHFTRPHREHRYLIARKKLPHRSGLALEEKTAVILSVREKTAKVIGAANAHYFPPFASEKEPSSLKAGDRVNLVTGAIERMESHDAISGEP